VSSTLKDVKIGNQKLNLSLLTKIIASEASFLFTSILAFERAGTVAGNAMIYAPDVICSLSVEKETRLRPNVNMQIDIPDKAT
jgi:hypothetical protein